MRSWSRETYLVKYLLRKMKQIYYIFPIELKDSNNICCYHSVSIICVSHTEPREPNREISGLESRKYKPIINCIVLFPHLHFFAKFALSDTTCCLILVNEIKDRFCKKEDLLSNVWIQQYKDLNPSAFANSTLQHQQQAPWKIQFTPEN